jgi:hypothetical protein
MNDGCGRHLPRKGCSIHTRWVPRGSHHLEVRFLHPRPEPHVRQQAEQQALPVVTPRTLAPAPSCARGAPKLSRPCCSVVAVLSDLARLSWVCSARVPPPQLAQRSARQPASCRSHECMRLQQATSARSLAASALSALQLSKPKVNAASSPWRTCESISCHCARGALPHMQRNPARLHPSLGHRKGRVEYRRLRHGPSRRLRSPPHLPLVRFHCLPRQHGTVMMVKTQPPSHARPVQRQPQTVPFASVAAAWVAGAVRTRGVRPVTPGCLRCPVRRTLGRTLFVAVRQ